MSNENDMADQERKRQLRAQARLLLGAADELEMTPRELIRACERSRHPPGTGTDRRAARRKRGLLVFAFVTAAVILVSLAPTLLRTFSPYSFVTPSPLVALAQQEELLDDGVRLPWLREALTDPADPYRLRAVNELLAQQNAEEVLLTLAVEIARLRALDEFSVSDGTAEDLLQGLLLVFSDQKIPRELRTLSLTLVARLFLENEVDTLPELARTHRVRETLHARLAIETDVEAFLAVVSALSCCGTTKSASHLHDYLLRAEAGSERERLLTVALGRLYRRALLFPELETPGAPLATLHANLEQAAASDSLTADLLVIAAQYPPGSPGLAQALAARYGDQDTYDPARYLTTLDLDEVAPWERDLTQPDRVAPPPGGIASWHFYEADRRHRGTAGPARGQNVLLVPDHPQPQLRLNQFGRSVAVFPFRLDTVPEHGIEISLHQLAAQRSNLPFLGAVRFTVNLDGLPIVRDYELTRPQTGVRDVIRVSAPRLSTGEHELAIELSERSTTTYWLLDVEIREVDGQ